MELTIDRLTNAVENHAAIRRVRWMQPVAGEGDKLFPPTYPGASRGDPPRHVFERRRFGNRSEQCVLLDSVPSQANRHEAALKQLRERGLLHFPTIAVDFGGTDIADVGVITSLDAPHRFCDAILRDSRLGERAFRKSPEGERLFAASSANAQALYEMDPAALNHGAWNSNGGAGVFGAKFARAVTSEIVGVGVATEPDGSPSGRHPSSRIDPLGIVSGVRVYRLPGGDWSFEPPQGTPERNPGVKPSEVLHGNIRPSVSDLGVSVDYALHTFVVSFAALRKLRFAGMSPETAAYARTALVALELAAAIGQDLTGYFLRSRCDLVAVSSESLPAHAPSGAFELVKTDGSVERCEFDLAAVCKLVANASGRAAEGGLRWRDRDLVLSPQPKLVELIQRSRQHALQHPSVTDDQADG